MSSACSGGMPCRLRKAKMGRQYVRQSFSSASRAAVDLPCAVSTTLQWVVVNATAPSSVSLPIVLSEAPLSSGFTLRSSKKPRRKSQLHQRSANPKNRKAPRRTHSRSFQEWIRICSFTRKYPNCYLLVADLSQRRSSNPRVLDRNSESVPRSCQQPPPLP